jgi:ribonuclease P protein component
VLAAAHRLRRRGDFTATIRAGRRAGRGVLVAHVLVPTSSERAPSRLVAESLTGRTAAPPTAGPSVASSAEPRVGFIVPRAVGGAVVRNRVRRQLRHLIGERLDALPLGAQIVIRVLPSAGERSFRELAHDLDAAIAAASRTDRARVGVNR